jgi:hypothetical protein
MLDRFSLAIWCDAQAAVARLEGYKADNAYMLSIGGSPRFGPDWFEKIDAELSVYADQLRHGDPDLDDARETKRDALALVIEDMRREEAEAPSFDWRKMLRSGWFVWGNVVGAILFALWLLT